MSSFKNVSGVDLELQVDGRRYPAAAGKSVSIPDEFDSQLELQPDWALDTKSAKTPEPVSATEEKK